MKQSFSSLKLIAVLFFAASFTFFSGCEPSIELTGTWHDPNAGTKKFSKIVVMAIGKNLSNRTLGEDNLVAKLKSHGFNAVGSLTFLPPDFQQLDSATIENSLKKNGVDAAITVRVVSKSESQRYVPGTTYAAGYPGYYGYWGGYYSSYGYYSSPGYTVTDVEVLLETNLYDLSNNHLLWVGQSKAFTNEPTQELAEQYAHDVVNDLVNKKIIAP